MTNQQPLLPAEPWYASPAQRAAVLGIIAGMAAAVIDLFGLSVDAQVFNAKLALVGQLVSLGFNVLTIIKRGRSDIAPLTLTSGGAEYRNLANPPMLDADPTKTTKVPK